MIKEPYGTERELTIKEGCPWYEAQQTYGAANVNWCEPTVCGYINEPANTWSNVPIILVGLILIYKFKNTLVALFGYCVAIMGLLSFIYHASNNFLTQYIDFLGMFLVMSFLLSFAWRRLVKKDLKNISGTYWLFFSAHAVIFMLFHITEIPVQRIMFLNAGPVILFELYIGLRDKILTKYTYFFLGLGFIVIAQAFAILDIQRIWCNPDNLVLHGHVLWHIFSGVFGMFFMGLHFHKMCKLYPA